MKINILELDKEGPIYGYYHKDEEPILCIEGVERLFGVDSEKIVVKYSLEEFPGCMKFNLTKRVGIDKTVAYRWLDTSDMTFYPLLNEVSPYIGRLGCLDNNFDIYVNIEPL